RDYLTCVPSPLNADRGRGRDLCIDSPCTDHDPSGVRAQSGRACLPSNLENIHHRHSEGHTRLLQNMVPASSSLYAISSGFLRDTSSRRPTCNPALAFEEVREPHAAVAVDRFELQWKPERQTPLQQSGA